MFRKAKTQLELNLTGDVKGYKNNFYKYTGDKSKIRENVGPLLRGSEAVVTQNMEKAETLNDFFASVFARKARHL